jgi:transforming growth factor-beta-induced protein
MDPALLGSVLDTHVVEGAYLRADLTQAGSVTALDGYALPIREPEGMLIVDYALVDGEPIQASNGVLYVINTLLLSPETGPEKSMWGILQADGRFTTFVSILEGGEFMTDLRFKDNYDAIVAPTDEAFANMPANVTNWLENNPHDYEFVAFFHLLSPDGWPQGTDLTVADMVELGSVQTRIGVSGSGFGFGFEELPVSQTESGVTIGGAQIIEGDIDASNGIVHAIDTVLIPQALMDHIEE